MSTLSESPAADPAAVAGGAFAALLRGHRQRRRLSQLQLAAAAELSQRHLSYLEVGRARPSRAMALQLAQALGLPLRERNRLLVAAGFAPLYPQRGLDAPDMALVRQALQHLLQHHDPYPAMVMDRQWNLLMVNPAAQRLVAALGEPEAVWARVGCGRVRNLMKLALHREGLRPATVNLDEVAATMLAHLERDAIDSAASAALLAELRRDYELSPRWQPTLDRSPPPVLATHFRIGGVDLRLFGVISTFGTPQDLTTDELRVETMFPADAASDGLLRAWAAAPR